MLFDPTSRTWFDQHLGQLLRLRLGSGDVLSHVYWGPSLTLEQAVAVPIWEPSGVEGFGGLLDGTEELPVGGGVRHGVPSLRCRP